MVALAPIPSNETARLAALHSYELLDTPPDERFDLFTRLGSWLFNAPMSAINLVDSDRTFFKSLIGLPSYEPRRCTSICAHAVGDGDVIMVVEDLTKDVRFKDHPLVLEKGVRFYAGALLRSHSGIALGTLCIADVEPRQLSTEDRQKLIELAEGVGAVLELHRRGLMLLQAATRDTLTGLYTRRAFDEKIQNAVDKAKSGKFCALLCLDLDHFKDVNDRFGHAGGDALLREVSRRLTQTVRPGDIVARLGGDEFVVLMMDATSVASAELLAIRLLAAFASPFDFEGNDLPIHSSIGIALCPSHANNPAALLRNADLALYEAKNSGRGHHRMYRSRELVDEPALECA